MKKFVSSRVPRIIAGTMIITALSGIISCSTSPDQPIVTLKEKNNLYQVRVNTDKWNYSDKNKFDLNTDASFEFIHKKDDAYAMIISERISFNSMDTLMSFVEDNLYKGANSVNIMVEDYRVVNGKEVCYMKAAATLNSVNFIYEGYYYTGPTGTIQFSTWTGENLFKEYEQDMTDLLNGLTIF